MHAGFNTLGLKSGESHWEIFQNKGKYLSSVAGGCFESVNIKQTDAEYFNLKHCIQSVLSAVMRHQEADPV